MIEKVYLLRRKTKYIAFVLRDVGALEIEGIYYEILWGDDSKPKRAYYANAFYRDGENIILPAVIEIEDATPLLIINRIRYKKVLKKGKLVKVTETTGGINNRNTILIDGIRYRTIYKKEPLLNDCAVVMTAEEEQVVKRIIEARDDGTYMPEEYEGHQRKACYKAEYVKTAWRLYPEIKDRMEDFANLVNEMVKNYALGDYRAINTDPPTADDEIIYIPIEVNFDKRFFFKLNLLKKHMVVNQIASNIGLLQYEVPIKKSNRELLVLLYYDHYGMLWGDMFYDELGVSLCADTMAESFKTYPHSALLEKIDDSIYDVKDDVIIHSDIAEKYLEYEKWPDNWFKEGYKVLSAGYKRKVWKSELRLYWYLKVLFPDAVYQYRADWLGKQSLDIYIPSHRCGIEYQGKQHFEPVDFFGGNEQYLYIKDNDQKKVEKCAEAGVRLLKWPYTEKLHFQAILAFANGHIPNTYISDDAAKMLLCKGPFSVESLLEELNYLSCQ